jgi:hypothetical protein
MALVPPVVSFTNPPTQKLGKLWIKGLISMRKLSGNSDCLTDFERVNPL